MSEFLVGPTALVERVVLLSAERGDGVGLASQIHRLRALLEPQVPPTPEHEAIMIEHDVLLWVLARGVEPSIAVALFRHLDDRRRRAGLTEGSDPWVRARPDRLRQRRNRVAEELAHPVALALRLCGRYERTRRSRYVFEAVKSLEAAADCERAALSPRPSPRDWKEEVESLAGALSHVLPPFAYTFLVAFATERIEEAAVVAGRPAPGGQLRRGAKGWRWPSLDALAGESSAGEPDDRVWFVGDMGERYRQEVAEATRRREEHAQWQADCAREREEQELRDQQLLQQKRDDEIRAEKDRQQRVLRSERRKAKAAQAEKEGKVRAAEERYREQLAIREQEAALVKADWDEYVEAMRRREEVEAERLRKEAEDEARRLAWKAKRQLKESPPWLQRAGTRIEWLDELRARQARA